MFLEPALCSYVDNFIIENDKLVTEIEQFLDIESDTILFESFKDTFKRFINKAIEFFKKIKRGFDNFIINLNYLKKSTVYVEMDNDIKTILQMFDPSMNLKYIEVVNNCYTKLIDTKIPYNYPVNRNSLDKYIPDTMENGRPDLTILLNELGDIYSVTGNIINRVKESKEYERITTNKYSGETTVVSTGVIIEDIKVCNSKIDNLTKLISKLNNTPIDDNPGINSGIINVIRKCIEYYTLKIDVLNYYLKDAKYNLKFYKYNKSSIKPNETTYRLSVKITEIIPNQDVCNLVKSMYSANESKNFSEYMNLHKQLCDKLGVSNKSDIRFSYDIRKISPNSKVGIQVLLNDYKTINISGRTLYHHEYQRYIGDGPREIIEPTAIGNRNTTLYPEPRIYFFIDLAFNKNGEIIRNVSNGFSRGNLYKLITNETTAYKDPIFINRISGSGSAAFIITTTGVKAELVLIDDYYNSPDRNYQ